MKNVLKKWSHYLMKPDEFRPLLPENEIPKAYTYWRFRIMISIFIGYAVYYFTRGTLAIIMPDLKAQGYDEVSLGWMVTFFQISYGFSKFASGVVADQSNPRYFMAIGLILTGIINIVFGFVPSIFILILLWSLNGYFQGWGSAPCHRVLTHWYSKSERGRWWGIWNTSHNVGAAILPLVATSMMALYGIKAGMVFPGIVAVIFGIILMIALRDTPQSLGLPAIEIYKNEVPVAPKTQKEERELTTKEILFTYVLNNKWVWGLAISYFLIYIVRWSLSQWIFHFLVDAKHAEKWMAAKTIFWFEAGGFVGGLIAGFLSDVVFKGKRGPVNVIFATLMIPALVYLWRATGQFSDLGTDSPISIYIFMGLTGMLIFGPQMLIAVAAAEVSHKKAAATAVGFLGVIAYVGCSLTGGPLGHMIKNYGWDFYFITLIVCSALAAICLLPFLKK